jgi:hypothetical protein
MPKADPTQLTYMRQTAFQINSKHELVAIMAEHDGVGIPLAYILRKTVRAPRNAFERETLENEPAHTRRKVLMRLKELGVEPRSVGSNKDFQEIRAALSVWPAAKHQLWYVLASVTPRRGHENLKHHRAIGTPERRSASVFGSRPMNSGTIMIRWAPKTMSYSPATNSTSPSCLRPEPFPFLPIPTIPLAKRPLGTMNSSLAPGRRW